MPNTISSVAIAKQIVRSGTSPYANSKQKSCHVIVWSHYMEKVKNYRKS